MKKIISYYPIFIIGLSSTIICILLHIWGIFSIIEIELYDLRFLLRGPNSNFDSKVVLVEINDESPPLLCTFTR